MRSLQLEDFYQYRFLSTITLSPDGQNAAFVVSQANAGDNGYDQNIWLWRSGEFLQLTTIGREGSFLWDDDCTLLFPGPRSKPDQKRQENEDITIFHRIRTDGGEAQRAFSIPVQVIGLRRIREGRYLVIARCDARYPDYYAMTAEEREAVAKEHRENADYQVLDEIPYWSNGNGFTGKLRRRLFLFDEESQSLTPITDALVDTEAVTLCGDQVVYAGEEYRHRSTMRQDLYSYDMITGETACFYNKKEFYVDSLHEVDGRVVMVAATGARYGLNENNCFYTVDVAGGIDLLADPDLSVGNTVGSDCRYGAARSAKTHGGYLYFIATRGDSSHLMRLGTDGAISEVIVQSGSVDDFDVGDGRILFTAHHGMNLQELFAASPDGGPPTAMSSFNREALNGRYVALPRHLPFPSNGREIDGWVLLPKNFREDGRYPAILNIHGGPKTVYGPVFHHEMQYWAGQGYFVLFCNPEGSDGRGNEFADLRGKYGTCDYDTLMTFTDKVLEAYPQIDPGRLGVTGGSYGGFMTNWIIGHTHRFAAAAAQRSISNWISFYGNSDIGPLFATDQMACDIYEGADKMWWHSPLKYAQDCITPTLFLHSDEDYRCWIPEALQMYTALMDRGIKCRLCWFKGENHELSRSGKPLHRVRRLREITDWMDRHLKA